MNPGGSTHCRSRPQTFKQLLMVAGMDKYFQIVRCFRDKTSVPTVSLSSLQVDCEMSFVEQEDVINTFEGLFKYLLKEIRGVEIDEIPRMQYD